MNTSEKNVLNDFDVFIDEDFVSGSQANAGSDMVGKAYRVPNLSARRKIEEYFEEKLLRNLTKGVFEE